MQDNRTEWELLPTEQLDQILNRELRAERPNGDKVRAILDILREREKDEPVDLGPEAEAAWEEYCREGQKKCPRRYGSLLKAASILVIVGLVLFCTAPKAEAQNIFDLFASWSDGFVEFFTNILNRNQYEYTFLTTHPGLQELYDTVTAAGGEGPAVPMWVEETMVLTECKTMLSPSKTTVYACLSDVDGSLTYKIDIYSEPVARKYYKDETVWDSYEENGITHTILRNNDLWVVLWSRDNIECAMSLDCQEDTLYDILGSIYNPVED